MCGYLQTEALDWLEKAFVWSVNDLDTGIARQSRSGRLVVDIDRVMKRPPMVSGEVQSPT
jgi:hypothetical protein